MEGMQLERRPRRNRKSKSVRDALAETRLSPNQMIQPIFISKETSKIDSMPGQMRYGIKDLQGFCESKLKSSKIMGVMLFASVDESLKSSDAKEALNPEGLLPQSISMVKELCPNLEVMSDVALDPFSSDGHDGLVKQNKILNDETVEMLSEMAVVHARAGADWVGPSDMMDGRVGAIRQSLDSADFKETSIIAYTAKYASSFYGPFRDALDSAPKSGDKKTYQMDFRNSREALLEMIADEAEGADVLMVKPALAYLDIISLLRENTTLPIAAYNVSAEYSMVKAAHERGWVDGDAIQNEILISIARAGADIIFSYDALGFESRCSK